MVEGLWGAVAEGIATGNWIGAEVAVDRVRRDMSEAAAKASAAAEEAISYGLDTEEYEPDGFTSLDSTTDADVTAMMERVDAAQKALSDAHPTRSGYELYGASAPSNRVASDVGSSADEALVPAVPPSPRPPARSESPTPSPTASPPACRRNREKGEDRDNSLPPLIVSPSPRWMPAVERPEVSAENKPAVLRNKKGMRVFGGGENAPRPSKPKEKSLLERIFGSIAECFSQISRDLRSREWFKL